MVDEVRAARHVRSVTSGYDVFLPCSKSSLQEQDEQHDTNTLFQLHDVKYARIGHIAGSAVTITAVGLHALMRRCTISQICNSSLFCCEIFSLWTIKACCRLCLRSTSLSLLTRFLCCIQPRPPSICLLHMRRVKYASRHTSIMRN